MKKEKMKQYLLIFTAVFLIAMGYLTYDDGYNSEYLEVSSRGDNNDINLGDVELVSTNAIVGNEELKEFKTENIISSSISIAEVEKTNNLSNYSNDYEVDEYFEKTRIERDSMYSQMLETYQKMIENEEISVEQKSIAGQEITNITKAKNGIMIAENLIKNKGFDDVVILVNNNIASVVVKSKSLQNEQIAKIQNIVSRELDILATNINISNK